MAESMTMTRTDPEAPLCNGFSQVGDHDDAVYCDMKAFWSFWAETERLGVPFYLHPRKSDCLSVAALRRQSPARTGSPRASQLLPLNCLS